MAQITINEISQGYSYNIGTSSYATVALPITSSWGPGYFNPDNLDDVVWSRFAATSEGLEAFVAAYRGPAANYRLANDYSYQLAMTLLTAGYDVLVCRLSAGSKATGSLASGDYVLLTSQPGDWATAYESYFTKTGANQYVPVEGVITEEYVALPSGATKPDDWDTTYNTKYYVQDGTDYVLNEESVWSTAKAQGLYTKEEVEVAPAFVADTYYEYSSSAETLSITAKYPGTFGNNLRVEVRPITFGTMKYWNIITYAVDSTGVATALENLTCVFNVANSTDSILYYKELESKFINLEFNGTFEGNEEPNGFTDGSGNNYVALAGGTDKAADESSVAEIIAAAKALAVTRYGSDSTCAYISALQALATDPKIDVNQASTIKYMEWNYTRACEVYTLLSDKLTYNPNRIISPGWDDQDFSRLGGTAAVEPNSLPIANFVISPLHKVIMNTAYVSRCATGYIDVPRSLARKYVYAEFDHDGYAQKLSDYQPSDTTIGATLFSTHSALFAPWGQYTYVGTGKMTTASPSFLALMIQRAEILNQATQFEWALPTNRKHNLNISKLAYTVTKKLLDEWQKLEGVGVNAITQVPDLGTSIWGNSTLYNVPPATYQALANLSTRFLVNAIEDIVYRVGIGITFQYNNDDAYSAFYAGVSPLLDTMQNVGAIDGYKIKMAADINGLDSVNANSVLGQIYLKINGVIQDITVDLVCLPPSADLSQF